MNAHRFLAGIFFRPFGDIIWPLPNHFAQREKGRSIYLTFDDGPYPPVTKRVLEILREFKVPATFFLSGSKLFAHRAMAKGFDYEGHSIGNHFFNHVPAFGFGSRKILRELDLTDRLIEQNFGKRSQLFRPPYGIFGPALLKALRKRNKRMILWSLMSNDFKWEAERTIDYLKRSVRDGDVIVFHDSAQTEKVVPEILPEFIRYCRKKRLEFETISTTN